MTTEEAITLLGKWPEDRSVPRRLREGIDGSRGKEKEQLSQLAEVLFAASLTEDDIKLVKRYFG